MRSGVPLFGTALGLLAAALAGPPPAGAWFALAPVPVPSSSRLSPPVPDSVSGGYPFSPSVRTPFETVPKTVPPKSPGRHPFLPGLFQVGAAVRNPGGDYTVPVRGFGHEEPVREVLAQLLGPGWTGLYRGVAPGTRIDWTGGRTLPRILLRVARTYGWRIRVDWNARTILLGRPGVPGPPIRTKTGDK